MLSRNDISFMRVGSYVKGTLWKMNHYSDSFSIFNYY